MRAGVGEVVVAGDVGAGAGVASRAWFCFGFQGGVGGFGGWEGFVFFFAAGLVRELDVVAVVGVGMVVLVAEGGVAHCHELDDEHEEDDDEADTFHPGVLCDRSGQAWVGECRVGGC